VVKAVLKDPRDVVYLHTIFNMVLIIPTAAAGVLYLHATGSRFAVLASVCMNVLHVLALARMMLMLHFWSHLAVTHSHPFNTFMADFISICARLPHGVYHMHHVRMHHTENNQRGDSTTTNPYRRDSPLHFLMYYVRFAYLVWFETSAYAVKDFGRSKKGAAKVKGSLHFFSGVASFPVAIHLCARCFGWSATWWVLVLPHLLTFLALSFGNFSQHIFVCPKNPTENCLLTYNCVDCFENKFTFNDGYHILHHENGRRHWSELPQYFHNNLKRYKEKGAITFRTIGFFEVGALVMTGHWEKLARHYVHIPGEACGLPKDEPPTVKQVVAMLKERVQPC